MSLHALDWALVVAYFVLTVVVGLAFSRRASSSMVEFFVSGRSLPWWLAGTSMVATTFAADTPLAVTGLVVNNGIAGNWLWWNFLMSGMLTVFLYARLWRRSGVLTDVEFTEIRYGGKPAAVLRAFRALYLAIPINAIIMGWVTLAMVKILGIVLGVGRIEAIVLSLAVVLLYSTLSGLWGVVVTDFVQFAIAMTGSIALAVFTLSAVGGVSGLEEKLAAMYPATSESLFRFVPEVGSAWMPISAFLVYVFVQWWAAWYPGAEPGGGGYIAQRIFSAKDEKHSLLATLWFNVAHYALRPWPWILVALASMVLYPDLADKEAGYVRTMVDHMPTGFLGLMVAAFFAAFMSTISTQLNWGSSYLINDFYRRFLVRERDEGHYVRASRIATVITMLLAGLATLLMETISGAWRFLLALGAGSGSVYILRWYLWRINAWSEIAAMAASLVTALTLQLAFGLSAEKPKDFAALMLITVAVTTIVWLAVTFLTRPEDDKVLQEFYRRVRPGGPGWRPIRARLGLDEGESLWPDFRDWAAGCVLVYASLFAIGKLLLGRELEAAVYAVVAAAAGWVVYRDLSRRGWASIAD
ncbi:MAG: Na+:solute symporter [candidate division KSB1 bacterium]|nr:Na+:solute symporter [candidate division KSB1 bacterium]